MSAALPPELVARMIADPGRERTLVVLTCQRDGEPPVPPADIQARVGDSVDVVLCQGRGVTLGHLVGELLGETGLASDQLGVRNGAARCYPPNSTGWQDGDAIAPLALWARADGPIWSHPSGFARAVARDARKAGEAIAR